MKINDIMIYSTSEMVHDVIFSLAMLSTVY